MKKQQRQNALVPEGLLEVLSQTQGTVSQSRLPDQLRVVTEASEATENLEGEVEDLKQENEKADGMV